MSVVVYKWYNHTYKSTEAVLMKKSLSILLSIIMVMSVFTVVPFSVTAQEADIALTADLKSGDYFFTIYGYSDTYAQKYAKDNEFKFVALDKLAIGDADGDDNITVMDATVIQMLIAGLLEQM